MASTSIAALKPRGRPPLRAAKPRLRETAVGLLFSTPALAITLLFTVYPLVQSVRLSFMRWDLIGEPTFVGLDNYEFLASSPAFRDAGLHTLVYVVATLIGTYLIALLAALLLNEQLKGSRLLRTFAVVPVLLPMVVAGLVWRWLLQPNSGLISSTTAMLFGSSPNWLFDSALALPSVIMVGIWKEFGLYMLVFLIALQGIRPELLEAAQLDGAGSWQRFRAVILPHLRPATIFTVTLITFNSLKVFDQVYVMTRGGPGGATRTLVMFVYEKVLSNVGVASAASVVLFVIALTVSVIRFRRDRSLP